MNVLACSKIKVSLVKTSHGINNVLRSTKKKDFFRNAWDHRVTLTYIHEWVFAFTIILTINWQQTAYFFQNCFLLTVKPRNIDNKSQAWQPILLYHGFVWFVLTLEGDRLKCSRQTPLFMLSKANHNMTAPLYFMQRQINFLISLLNARL